MKPEIIKSMVESFEDHSYTTEEGTEFWHARDLQHLLGYTQWRNFLPVITKAKTACDASGNEVKNHFADVRKMVQIGSGVNREIQDTVLTRYACYLLCSKLFCSANSKIRNDRKTPE